MTNDKTAVIDVQFNMSEATTGADEIKGILEGLEEASNSFATSISNAFLSMLNCLKEVQSGIGSVAESLGEAVGKLSEVETSTETTEQAMGVVDGISAAYSAIKQGVKNYDELEKTSKSLESPFAYLVLSNNMSELVKSMFPQTSVLAGMVGEWTNDMLLPNIVSGLNKISPSIGAGAEKMFGSITSAFGKVGTAIGNLSVGQGALIAVAIAAIVALVKIIIDNWDTIVAALSTAADWFNTNVIQPIVGFFTTAIDWISTKLQEGMAFVQGIFAGISEFLQGMFAKDWTEQFGAFGNVLNAFFANFENIWNSVKDIFNGIVGFVKNVFAGDWGAAWDSVVGIFKGIWDLLVSIVKAPINIIIGLINGLVQGVVDGINLVIGALNNISFDIPDWVPVIGGQTFGFNLTPLVAPKIPLLAQGAVLPANRPFLAMVGDQRHGTNIEAPLATIQEAVAQVMENQFSGMMAGFEASVAVQKQILQAVLGIEVGDTTIGQAANRYNRRMAIIKGGM